MQLRSMMVALGATAASAFQIAAVSWKDPRMDLFGLADKTSLWHKFYTGWDWQPQEGFERVPAIEASTPSAVSWGEGHLDLVYVNASGSNVLHKYFVAGSWGPSWEEVENLGGDVVSVVSHAWGDQRLDLVAKRADGAFLHKAWTGSEWYPSVDGWEDFGGEFSSDPAVGSWGPGRLDIIGISDKTGSIYHKFWFEGWSTWEDLGGGPFVGTPKITSWGPQRFDIWAIDEYGQLNHLVWDGTRYLEWENLGGVFEETPVVVHWNVSKIDIVGKTGDAYVLKAFTGTHWVPEGDGWSRLASPFESEPAVLARHDTNLINVFGIDEDNSVRLKLWTGYGWEPAAETTWSLGDLPAARLALIGGDHVQGQDVLGEL